MSAENSNDQTAVTVQHMRDAVAARAANTSLRDVARAIGMSASGVKKFLEGSMPYSATMQRLRHWYVHHGAVQRGIVELEDARAALGILAHDLPPHARRGLARRVIDEVGRAYDGAGKQRPAWLPQLRAQYETRSGDPDASA